MVGTIAGKYQIVDLVGRGSMGTVYRAQDRTLHRDVAIKVLNADASDPAAARRFRAEAVAVARLNHPGIAKVFDLFEHDGQLLMAMELVAGETLESLVSRTGPLPAEQAADLMSQALEGLSHAHAQGVIHRDLKPANLMVSEGHLKIMDFGIARVAGTEHLTSVGFLMGTPAYMAPEQLLGHEVDARTDVFAIGCVMYFLATGKLPFKGQTALEIVESRLHDAPTPVRSFRHELPEWFAQVVARALAKDPGGRFQTADEFRDAIGRGRAGLPLLPAAVAPAAASHVVAETMLPGAMPVAASANRSQADAPGSFAETIKTPAALSAPRVEAPGVSKPMARSLAAIAAVIVIAAAAVWFWPGGTETASTSLPPTVQSSPPVQTPDANAQATSVPANPASPGPTTVSPSAVPSATPAITSAGRGRKGADAPASFSGVKLLRVTGHRGEDVDATLTFGNGLIAVDPRRDVPRQSLQYDAILAATFVKDRDPRWASNLAGPPSDLELPSGLFTRRGVRNWLVLQGKSFYIVLSFSEADRSQILATLSERTRVKIDQPGPAR